MNLPKYKGWKMLLYRVIAKQQSIREETHPVCLYTTESYKKVESVKQQVKNWTHKKKADLFFVFCK